MCFSEYTYLKWPADRVFCSHPFNLVMSDIQILLLKTKNWPLAMPVSLTLFTQKIYKLDSRVRMTLTC